MSRNIDPADQLLIFGMKNIFLENALDELEKQGIEIGHAATRKDQEKTVDTELFEHDILVTARTMADFYVLYFALENSVRRLLIAHSCELNDDEIQRFKLLINDWLRIQS